MKPKDKFTNLPLDFWSNVKLISQKLGYTERGTARIKGPSLPNIIKVYRKLGLKTDRITEGGKPTEYGQLLLDYFEYRARFLNDFVKDYLMDKDSARELYEQLHADLNPKCPIPMNKQKGEKQAPAYFTAIINMLIEANLGGYKCNYDPRELTAFTEQGFPVRSLSRRVDGAFPEAVNPIAIWEVKEYYYTTTFGSRIADGVYETLLDGFGLAEARNHLGRTIHHYLMVDDYRTWWSMGRSYLCRICDMLHQGFLTEVLFGREVVERIPEIVNLWIKEYQGLNVPLTEEEREVHVSLE